MSSDQPARPASGGRFEVRIGARRLLRISALSAACVALPLLLYFVLLPLVLDGLVPDWRQVSNLPLTPAEPAERVADFAGRMRYGLGATVVVLLATVAMLYSGAALWNRRGPLVAAAALAIAAAGGVASYLADDHVEKRLRDAASPIGQFVDGLLNCDGQSVWETMSGLAIGGETGIDVGIARASCDDETIGEKIRALAVVRVVNRVNRGPDPPDPEMLDAIYEIAAVTGAFGVAALVALTLRFAEVAWRAPPRRSGPAGRAGELRARWQGLRTALMLSALVLTVSVIGARAYFDWPLTLLDADSARAYAQTSSAAAQFWGTLYTLVLLCVAVPAALALCFDVEAAADAETGDAAGREQWLAANRLTLNLPEGLSGALATAAPLLASPFIDALKGAAAAVGG